jgi:hypothetical protein
MVGCRHSPGTRRRPLDVDPRRSSRNGSAGTRVALSAVPGGSTVGRGICLSFTSSVGWNLAGPVCDGHSPGMFNVSHKTRLKGRPKLVKRRKRNICASR